MYSYRLLTFSVITKSWNTRLLIGAKLEKKALPGTEAQARKLLMRLAHTDSHYFPRQKLRGPQRGLRMLRAIFQ